MGSDGGCIEGGWGRAFGAGSRVTGGMAGARGGVALEVYSFPISLVKFYLA
jgi:hypothetical protein